MRTLRGVSFESDVFQAHVFAQVLRVDIDAQAFCAGKRLHIAWLWNREIGAGSLTRQNAELFYCPLSGRPIVGIARLIARHRVVCELSLRDFVALVLLLAGSRRSLYTSCAFCALVVNVARDYVDAK